MKITVVDYGAGNLPSVERALQSLGAETQRATAPEHLRGAERIVFPGVGHFSAAIAGLHSANLFAPLRQSYEKGVPILGICVGLQALFASSEEAPGDVGLGLLPGEVKELPATVKLPHIGWNQVRRVRESRLLGDLPADTYFYFAHSYAATNEPGQTVAVCDHGTPFAAVVESKNLSAVQFHPEKSGAAGARVLRNFLESSR
jgi:imidazole glycerol phosphate synthase glutamine amidotransferase subunit